MGGWGGEIGTHNELCCLSLSCWKRPPPVMFSRRGLGEGVVGGMRVGGGCGGGFLCGYYIIILLYYHI